MNRLSSALRHMPPKAAVFLLLLFEFAFSLASAYTAGLAAQAFFAASYLLPFLFFLLFLAQKEELHTAFSATREGFFAVLPLLPVFLASVLLVSTATGYLMTRLGLPVSGGASGGGDFPSAVLHSALLPAIYEESLCRIAVFILLSRTDKGMAVPQSALLFALLHANLYQLPYAFIGGLFLALAMRHGGGLYAMLFHFLNNLLSLVMQYLPLWLGQSAGFFVNLAIALALFLLAGWGGIVLYRRKAAWHYPHAWLSDLCRSPLLLYLLLMLAYACL